MTKADWIRRKLSAGVTRDQLYMMYKSFVKEAGDGMAYDTYKRKVREYSKSVTAEIVDNVKLKTEVEGANTTIVSESHEIRTLDQLLAYTRVDLNKFYVSKHVINSWGSADNPSFQVKAWLTLKDAEPESDEERIKELIEEAKAYMPVYPKIEYSEEKSGNMLEISLMDSHFGRLAWGLETGDKNYNLKIAEKMILETVESILSKSMFYNIDKILLPVGNDFFNVNDSTNTTFNNTAQSEDERWQKTFVKGRNIWIKIIEMCSTIAPVHALTVVGNHDTERTFYLMDSLECWFNNHESVVIDNSPKNRKVFKWGNGAIMYTHGCNEKVGDLPLIFATEFPIEFSSSEYRDIHIGHLHRSSRTGFLGSEDINSVDVIVKPSLVPLDQWSASKGYRALSRTEAEIWNKDTGKEVVLYHNI